MKVSKEKKIVNHGYICGIIMLLAVCGITALMFYLSIEKINAEMSLIFAREGFFNITKGILSFIGNISSKLKFGRGMIALSYLNMFCFASSILGFVQGVLFKKRDLIS